ncbi:helix-turn-helix domain-containing protein [Catenulispora subtropica]|uniref:Helix-turn-helix domain-containing protein n=1 Tax=Catenulispora subtropica TaxID=450798 RepID=A0ABN2RPI7_9ACTN
MLERTTVFPEPDHGEALRALAALLDAGEPLPSELPSEVNAALRSVLGIMRDTGAVVIASLPKDLSTGEAAELLGISRPTVVRLAEDGEIEYTRPSVHRRVSRESVLAYRERRGQKRRAGIEEMLRIDEEAGASTDDHPMKHLR